MRVLRRYRPQEPHFVCPSPGNYRIVVLQYSFENLMTTEQKKEITAYLCGPRDYSEGVRLYDRYGINLRLKRQFALDDNSSTREILLDELRKLAGLTEIEFDRLPRKAVCHNTTSAQLNGKTVKTVIIDDPKDDEAVLMELADSFGVTVEELVSPDFQERVASMEEYENKIDELTDELEEARSKYAEAPEPMRKMIRFREKYPFLNSPDCPDILKVLVADMFTAYGEYKDAHARLQEMGDEDSTAAAAECEKVVTEYLKNREIWEELDYYRENGTILGKAAKFREAQAAEDLTALSDVELISKLQSAGVQESKNKKKVADAKAKGEENEKAAAALEYWSTYKKALKAEADRRKKK